MVGLGGFVGYVSSPLRFPPKKNYESSSFLLSHFNHYINSSLDDSEYDALYDRPNPPPPPPLLLMLFNNLPHIQLVRLLPSHTSFPGTFRVGLVHYGVP